MRPLGNCKRATIKKIRPQLWILFITSTLVSSCLKEGFDPQKQFEIEKPIIEDYVKSHMPDAVHDERTGIWYTILEEAPEDEDRYEYTFDPSGVYVIAPEVEIKYLGRLLNGTEFDSNSSGISFDLNLLIAAWQIMFYPSEIDDQPIGGILEGGLQKGMKVRFVTPSYYGYGERSTGRVPANSPLDFIIEVLDVRAPGSN